MIRAIITGLNRYLDAREQEMKRWRDEDPESYFAFLFEREMQRL
jgi:hypothetical protein